MGYIKTFISIVNGEKISIDNREKILSIYVSKLKKINKKHKILMLINILINILQYILNFIAVCIPIIVDRIKKDIFLIIFISFISSFILISGKIFIDLLNIKKKLFVVSQVLIRFKIEGNKFLNYKKHNRYSTFNSINDATDTFLKKITRIEKFSVLENQNLDLIIKNYKLSREF
jgi:hypothetical protein